MSFQLLRGCVIDPVLLNVLAGFDGEVFLHSVILKKP